MEEFKLDEEIKKKIIDLSKDGKIVYHDLYGYASCDIEKFVKQPLDGMLYDVNRDEATLMTLMDTCEWAINDYALVQLLKYYKRELDKYKNENG